MPTSHVVEPGEHLSGIAAHFGFRTVTPILEHPDNAGLRARRSNPNVLLPGDVVVIPDLTPKQEGASTGRVNSFVADASGFFVNLHVERIGGQPMAGRATTAAPGDRDTAGRYAADPPQTAATDAKGGVRIVVDSSTVEAELTLTAKPGVDLEDTRFRLLVGGLNPVLDDDTGRLPLDASGQPDSSGVRARLENLGYFAGYTTRDAAQLTWAVEEFQCDHQKSHGLKVTGELDRKTLEALRKVHGDAG